jgi:hypothetical protein
VRSGPTENIDDALAALSADELREFVRTALARLDDGPRGELEDLLLQRAARAASGWKPAAPSTAFVEEAKSFIAAARRAGQADPSQVDHFLRQALTASLAGDHTSARAVFEVMFGPVGQGDIDLGQHELVEEVLTVDLHECVRRYAASVYLTTPIADRADALVDATETASELAHMQDPITDIEAAIGHQLPELDLFLPLWIARLERVAKKGPSDWESEQDRWLRAAIGRRDGVAGLAQLARTTKRTETARAWCDALIAKNDWSAALSAYEECAELIEKNHSRGEFFDGSALAAQVLGHKDLADRLEAAWLGAPSILRLSRWLLVGDPTSTTVRKRAAAALEAKPSEAPVLIGLLTLLVGKTCEAASLLSQAPGLGWSRDGHPGHVLFPAFAWLLNGASTGSLSAQLSEALTSPMRSLLDFGDALDEEPASSPPRLSRPNLLDLLQRADVARNCAPNDRRAMLDAMKTAAEQRADGVLDQKRRRHYEHAALLIAACVELDGAAAKRSPWVEALRARTARFPAFQAELRDALARATRSRQT